MKDFLKRLKLNEANIGLGMGVAVLILAGLLLISYFRSASKTRDVERTLSTSTDQAAAVTESSDKGTVVQPVAGSEYTVQKGDSLWKISMKTYNSGYSWSKIYEANKDKIGNNPSVLEAGTKLVLPGLSQAALEYKVERGDNLWNISVKMCNDGFVWTKLATDNKLENPRMIEPGITLKVSCR